VAALHHGAPGQMTLLKSLCPGYLPGSIIILQAIVNQQQIIIKLNNNIWERNTSNDQSYQFLPSL